MPINFTFGSPQFQVGSKFGPYTVTAIENDGYYELDEKVWVTGEWLLAYLNMYHQEARPPHDQ